jgi:hypothetical protein
MFLPFSTISSHFYFVILNSFPNKHCYHLYYIFTSCLNTFLAGCKNQEIDTSSKLGGNREHFPRWSSRRTVICMRHCAMIGASLVLHVYEMCAHLTTPPFWLYKQVSRFQKCALETLPLFFNTLL